MTTKSISPAAWAGVVALIEVAVTVPTVRLMLPFRSARDTVGLGLKLKFVPVIVTEVPPAVEPAGGLMFVIVGPGGRLPPTLKMQEVAPAICDVKYSLIVRGWKTRNVEQPPKRWQ